MAFTSPTRLVNPRLGTYYGIFVAAFASVVLMALMFEQLGATDAMVRLIMFAGPLALYAAIGIFSAAREPGDYFACGRRVPAFFNGLVLAIAALGGAGFMALTGSLLMVGFDAICLSIGLYAGLVFMVVLFAPFLRKLGAYTVPTFLGRRHESRTVRVVAAGILSVPILLLLAAEARFAAYASAWLLGQSEGLMAVVIMACVAATVIAGGMRSLTWASVAKAIAALLALAVPATIVAVMISNLPLPQMTHGNIVRVLTRLEAVRGVPIIVAPPLAFDLPGVTVEPLTKRFIQAFGSVGGLGFVLMSFVVAMGIAASPALLPRSGTTPGVYEARKSGGWAVLVAGIVLLTLPAVAVYLRTMIVEQVVGHTGDQLPIWFQLLQQAGVAKVDSKTQLVALANIGFERDAAIFALPIAAGFPQVLVYLALAGALAAALAALAASLVSAAAILAEDVVHGLPNETAPENARIGTARVALLGVAFVTAWLAIAAPADPLQLFLWGLAFSAAASFPVLLLSIWWKRLNAWGAMAGMITGFSITAFIVLLSEIGALALPSPLSGAIAMPLAFVAAIGVSLVTPAPGKSALDALRDLRVPGGETMYDREMRLLRLKSRVPS
ncbi:MAG: sodium:solute symporter [Hyphomicrobiaceae bacterium]|nr:MAG: sodium:solute symporter [Hyphomicrobiaceae bacterium]